MHAITEQYKIEIDCYSDFKIKMEVLIRELLIQNKVNFHKIEARIKEPNKLEEKILRKNDKYKVLNDITDLIGIRVITYFEDEVDKVAQIIDSEFILDKENSIDKRKIEFDKFGYKSLHYVIALTEERKQLTEYKRFNNFKIELQIRSILQHAWAEIEHDIGYKGEHSIPDVLKRNFYRVAALLEMADIEFVNIKDKIKLYENSVTETIKKHPEDVELNSASLKSFIENNAVVIKLDQEIAANGNYEINNTYNIALDLLEKLYFLNIKTIKELEVALVQNSNEITAFAKVWLPQSKGSEKINQGISIFYLGYIIIAKSNDLSLAQKYFFDVVMKGIDKANIKDTLQDILDLYKRISIL